MTQSKHIATCGWCKYFKRHKSKTGYANGYWLGDGNCKQKKAVFHPLHGIARVEGDSCVNHKAATNCLRKVI